MARVAVTSEDGTHAGHFDWAKARRWSDRDVNGNGSGGTGRGEAVMLTAGGQWALEHWTNWQGQVNTYQWITPDEAHAWLIRNGETEAVDEHFGDQPDEVDLGGRPPIGKPVLVRLGDQAGKVDAYAARYSLSRAEAVRELVGTSPGRGERPPLRTMEFSYRGGTIGGAQEVVRQATLGIAAPPVQQAGRLGFQVTAGTDVIDRLRGVLAERGEECYVTED